MYSVLRSYVSNKHIRDRNGQTPAVDLVMRRRLRLLGHVVRSDVQEDHSRALRANMNQPPRDWKRHCGRPRLTWLRTIEQDVQQFNLELHSAYRFARDRLRWRKLVETVTWLRPSGQALDDYDNLEIVCFGGF